MYVEKYPSNWAKELQSVIFAYNISVHSSTQETPFRLIFHREPTLPVWIGLLPDSTGQVGDIRRYFKEAIETAQESEMRAAENTNKMQRKNKENHDSKITSVKTLK